jgi:hypothetical protein
VRIVNADSAIYFWGVTFSTVQVGAAACRMCRSVMAGASLSV